MPAPHKGLEGLGQIQKNLEHFGINLESCVRTACWRLGGKIMTQAKDAARKPNFTGTPSDDPEPGTPTGRLAGSITMRSNFSQQATGLKSPAESGDAVGTPGGDGKDAPTVVVGTNVEYACVIGSRQSVYNPVDCTSANIGNYPFDHVLSKDGRAHKILERHRFHKRHIGAVSIRTRVGRHPLEVTSGHLVLIQRGQDVFWESAGNILLTDMVFGKRSLGAITDHSNETLFPCPCGKSFYVLNSRARLDPPKYCSKECYHKFDSHIRNEGMTWTLSEAWRESRRGSRNPQWRDGSSRKKYPAEFNNHLKRRVKERDNYRCQYCGSGDNLVVHHMDWNKHNNDINNLLTLCASCHGSLNKMDCELPDLENKVFVAKPILEIRHLEYRQHGKPKIPYIYDFSVKDENSYVVSGILVHNSHVELGTKKMSARPYLYPAFFSLENDFEQTLIDVVRKKKALEYFKAVQPTFDPGEGNWE